MDYDMLFTLMLIVIATLCIVMLAARRFQKPSEGEYETITLRECDSCGYRERRSFVKGDYVLKINGVCPKCGGPMTIMKIYVEKAEARRQKGYKQISPQ